MNIKINGSKQPSISNHPGEKQDEGIVSEENDVVEHLYLMLEEAFFLTFVLECLTVLYQNKSMNVNEMWEKFQQAQPYFIEKYIAYHYYRSRGWVVKSALKFGGDFGKFDLNNIKINFK